MSTIMTMRRQKRKPTTTSFYDHGVVLRRLRTARWSGLLAITLVGVHLMAGLPLTDNDQAATAELTVWKSPSCDCCGKWIEHIRAAGFAVIIRDTENVQAIKAAHGVPEALWSCHTAAVAGYVLEGHVPAQEIARLQAETPELKGLAVPGMPASAPGMEHPRQSYQVLAFGLNEPSVYATH